MADPQSVQFLKDKRMSEALTKARRPDLWAMFEKRDGD